MSLQERIGDQVRALDALDLQGLRAEWRRRWGAPPNHRSVQLLRFMIAWRVQAAAFGDLDQKTRAAITGTSSGPPPVTLEPGVRLAREWQGMRHEVDVVDGGFVYRGQRYGSLSEVARTITGSRWNGLRFFGLRQAPGRAAA